MSDEEDNVVICTRIQDPGPHLDIYTARCGRCAEPVGISAATHDYIKQVGGTFTYLCGVCFVRHHADGEHTVMPLSPGQLQEIREYLSTHTEEGE